MAIFKCKMCGGTLEINNNETVAVCEYCGTKQTLPKLDDERKASLYDRANYFRRENEFDKAMGIYEMILNEDYEDSESYWGIVLCRYGIEYVEDPVTHKRVPTVNRAQFTSIYDDEHYKKAYQYADGYQRDVYAAEAKVIDDIQKGILEISRKEEPFDVFICYKETDNNGRRTPDSVYAQDIYKALTEEGYKVFFSRITLEDKLGTAYEPYIFAALNSARVMLIVGTKSDHFNAVWVKNEWSRYLALVKSEKKKTIIPLYADISPYDLPEELSYIQAQDMTKIGFMQDLVHGINKIIPLKKPNPVNENVENQMVASMLQKALYFINSGDFKSANLCLDTVHAYDADDAMYYVCQLMIQNDCKSIEKISEIKTSIVDTEAYINAINNANDELREKLISYGYHTIYNEAFQIFKKKISIEDLKKAIKLIECINVDALRLNESDFADRVNNLKEKIEKEIIDIEEQEKRKAEKLAKEKNERQQKLKKIKKTSVISTVIISIISILFSVIYFLIVPSSIYSKGTEAYHANDFDVAMSYFATIRDYKDVEEIMYKIEHNTLKYAQIGDEVDFGVFNINGGLFRDKYAPIKWIVLNKSVGKVTLISKECLIAKPYNSILESKGWEGSTLWNWLDDDFKKTAFSTKEMENLNSRISILSSTQINYFANIEGKCTSATEYAKNTGVQLSEDGYANWWIQTNGASLTKSCVSSNGEIIDSIKVDDSSIGVRPLIEVKIDDTQVVTSELNNKKIEKIYNQALEAYKSKNFYLASQMFLDISEYKDSTEYLYAIKLAEAQPLFDSGNYTSYLSAIESLMDAGYEPAIMAYNKAKKEIDTQKAEAKAEQEKIENAMNVLNGMWKWQNFFGYYMEIKDGVISYGTNADKSVNHADEFWYDNSGTISYDLKSNTYTITNFAWAVKLTFDGTKIRMYDEYGDPSSFFDEYAIKYKN